MSTRIQQSLFRPVLLAVAEGATTPNPGTVNAVALSSVSGVFMRWTGAAWTGTAPPYASAMKWGVD